MRQERQHASSAGHGPTSLPLARWSACDDVRDVDAALDLPRRRPRWRPSYDDDGVATGARLRGPYGPEGLVDAHGSPPRRCWRSRSVVACSGAAAGCTRHACICSGRLGDAQPAADVVFSGSCSRARQGRADRGPPDRPSTSLSDTVYKGEVTRRRSVVSSVTHRDLRPRRPARRPALPRSFVAAGRRRGWHTDECSRHRAGRATPSSTGRVDERPRRRHRRSAAARSSTHRPEPVVAGLHRGSRDAEPETLPRLAAPGAVARLPRPARALRRTPAPRPGT